MFFVNFGVRERGVGVVFCFNLRVFRLFSLESFGSSVVGFRGSEGIFSRFIE